MARFSKHVFICGNQRPEGHPRGCCDPSAAGELQREFKKQLAAAGVQSTVRANKAGCLDQCEHGPTVVVYPEAVWYGHVQPADVAEIVASHVVGGCPVARLQLPEECINTPQCGHRALRSSS